MLRVHSSKFSSSHIYLTMPLHYCGVVLGLSIAKVLHLGHEQSTQNFILLYYFNILQYHFDALHVWTGHAHITACMHECTAFSQKNKSDISYRKPSRAFDIVIHSGKPNSVG